MDDFVASWNGVTKRVRLAGVLGLSIASGVFSTGAVAQTYRVTPIPTLGGTSNSGVAINASGQVVGTSCLAGKNCTPARNGESSFSQHAYLYTNGALQDLGTLGGRNDYSQATAVNSAGQVTGTSYATVGSTGKAKHTFLYSNGTMQDLGTLGGPDSIGLGINDAGQVTGQSDIVGGAAYHAYLYTDGSMMDLGTLGGTYSIGSAINNSGQVTGQSDLSGNASIHAFIYANGSMQDIGAIPGPVGFSSGAAINARGQVAGNSFVQSTGDGFIYSNGALQPLPYLLPFQPNGSTQQNAYGINALGQVVGSFITAAGGAHAFIYRNGVICDLNTLISSADAAKYTLEFARGINDRGQIVVTGYVNGINVFNPPRAFLLSPIAN